MSKVVLTCDQLVERNWTTAIFETFLDLIEDAEIFTLVHRPKAILGPAELRRIHSSYLSKFVEKENDLFKWSFLIPGAAKNLHISCTVDTVINISRGLSQGIKRCDKSKQITYLIDELPWTTEPILLRDRLFRSRLKKWAKDQLCEVDELWVTNQEQKELFEGLVPKVEVVAPFFKTHEYPLFPKTQRELFPHDFVTIEATDLSLDKAQNLIDKLESSHIKYRFVGFDDQLSSLKKENEDTRFYGPRCAGEMAPMLAASIALIDFSTSSFHENALATLATGRPVLTLKGFSKLENISSGVFSFENIDKIIDWSKNHVGDKFHDNALEWHKSVQGFSEVLFQKRVKELLADKNILH
ncbi:MAG: hypothetical protein COW00_16700 [Bdellovibrio sp. CG12_big_fil_rev_8_21_14_0_65_39_13]|nr:MAG: hypothetical protein COW78_09990 [Bdellovibrio sp. CG22_combo_CG10-13_8_21_14_all_39_27]PIQ58244.1 MAG: hypothetical protein COW00_16700 [Bdellovibrio sp. CG12_big_fil_rev_8_21_14_0_65_39_13]PIR36653.1 MAG: hypothetical protein COV37_02220 [Bdellovibrio sp. CG11_big_fil_rev_8_21_14_0_20_39_38]